jgi:hypothetical protein
MYFDWLFLDIRPGIAMHEPVVVAEDAGVAAVAPDLGRRVMVAETVELDDQPLGEVHVVGSDPMDEDVDRVGRRGS